MSGHRLVDPGPDPLASKPTANNDPGQRRAVDVDIPIHSTDLSRRHVMLKCQSQVTLLDLESRNGVYLNGLRVHSAVLHEGDTVQLGSVVFVFHEGH